MKKITSVGGKDDFSLLTDSLGKVKHWGESGLIGRPFCLGKFPQGREIWRAKATSDEMARAYRFRKYLADLSPEMEAAFQGTFGPTGKSQNGAEVLAISDKEINELAGPILKEFGYDIDKIASQSPTSGPAVFDVDLTEPFHEVREFQAALDLIVHAERLSPKTAYCFPVQRKSDTGAAVIAPLRTWTKMVLETDRGNDLVGHVRRAYDSLASKEGAGDQFQHCRVVHVQSCDEAASNAMSQMQRCSLKDNFEYENHPLVIVDGGTVVAALPRDQNDRVVSARVSVEVGDSDVCGYSLESPFLPDMNAIIAHVASERSLRGGYTV